ncbi:hypothetical protein RFI_37130 [Reticulomyxa filosa]|uniref:Uncharacterized protein n=1 Tax=Reticulomyxa filosa TaxID=46433 RepID=X6LGS8_RETFI|nr:hypothetical protein RFI_38294 [Reticulomyxa filosa]ETO00317.1 hypothetical protein RFI_37130 [Reticulomyxa filosa]|eukprot:ETN99189.1 hypothetical protein RFI_38294 [Reticulomyxa filosa]
MILYYCVAIVLDAKEIMFAKNEMETKFVKTDNILKLKQKIYNKFERMRAFCNLFVVSYSAGIFGFLLSSNAETKADDNRFACQMSSFMMSIRLTHKFFFSCFLTYLWSKGKQVFNPPNNSDICVATWSVTFCLTLQCLMLILGIFVVYLMSSCNTKNREGPLIFLLL